MSKINVRSPYYISYDEANLQRVDLELYIYKGEQVTDRVAAGYDDGFFLLRSFAVGQKVTFDISEIVRDYLTTNFTDGVYTPTNCWVDYRATRFTPNATQDANYTLCLAYNGYGYFEDGANPQNLSGLLQSNTKIVKLDDAPAVIPVDTERTTRVTYELNGDLVYTTAITSSLESDEQIEYVSSTINGSDEFEDRVIQDDGIFEGSTCLNSFSGEFTLFDFDAIYVDTTDGVIKINVENVTECKYDPHKVTFVNKFGALQDIWFFKSKKEVLSTTKEMFKRNILQTNTYNTSRHQQKILTKNGSTKLELNTGFYPEEYNEVFQQMQLSEECWIEINNKTLPVNVSKSAMSYKTHLNDKLINYAIELDFAYDTINNIR